MTDKSIQASNHELTIRFYETAVKDALDNLESPHSRRVYKQTYSEWGDFCHNRKISPAYIEKEMVKEFLDSLDNSVPTKRRKLAALRKLAGAMIDVSEDQRFQYISNRLKRLKIQRPDADEAERKKNALSPEQVYRIFSVWDKHSVLHKRNRAMIALLMMTGMRRAEVAALRWSDIDLERNTITIRHAKGNKPHTPAIIGSEAHTALRIWREEIPNHEYVFPSLGPHQELTKEDKPCDGQTVYRVVRRTKQLSGVHFSPHDIRRTLITELLENNVPLHEIQKQVGHAHSSTTLSYAEGTEASKRRDKLKLRYGG